MHRLVRILCAIVLMAGMLPGWGLTATPSAAAPQSSDIRISQVYGGGGNTGATYTHDFIELFNAGSSTISLAGWSVQYASATGTTWQVTALSGSIGPGQYYLIQEAQGAGGTTPLPTPDAIGTILMSATAGKVALVNSTTALSGGCPTGGSIVDFVGFGSTASCYEGSGPTPAPSNTTAVLRANGGCTDTDNNAADFTAGAPTPRNSAAPTHSCGSGPSGNLTVAKTGPATVLPGAAYTYTLTVQNTTGAVLTNVVLSDTLPISVTYASANPAGTWDVASHTITWTLASLANNTTLTYTLNVTAPTTWGSVSNAAYAAWATEWVTPTSGAPVNTVIKDCGSIAAIQMNRDANDDSLCKGSSVTVEGVVYAVYTTAGYAIADAAGPWHGLYIYTGSTGTKPTVGQRVRVTGTVAEYYNMTEISSGSSFTVLSSGNTPYTASVVAVADIATGAATAESYESVLVEVNDVTVNNASLGNGEWSVTAGGSTVIVDDLGYAYTPSVGDYLSVVRGMLNYSFSNFKIEPRYASDVVPGIATGLLVSKTGPATITAGSAFSYTLVVRNQTATQLDDLVVSDTLPLSVTFASATPSGTWNAASHTITWTQASVAHNTTLTYTIVVTAPNVSVMLNNSEYAAWASNWLTHETGSAVATAVLASGGLTPIVVARAAGAGWTGSIQGKVTVPPGIYRGNAFVIQDDTGGLYIYTGATTLPPIALGDTVRVTGTLKLYNGLLEIDPMTGIANLGSGMPPAPLNLTTGAVAANEGWLVQVTGTATWSGTPPTPDGTSDFTIYANDGSGAVQVFVDKDTRIDLRGYTSGQQLTIIGFVGNYNGTRQIMPRYQSDIWDMLPPEVTATYPAAGATDVYPYFPITATFSKALDAATVTTATFTLADANSAVAGVVSYNAGTRTATFDPPAALAPQTRYTATLTTGIKETHGIPMAANYVWSFTTGDADVTSPTITGRYPAPDAADLPLSVNVVVTFSETINPATLTGNFTLVGPYGAVPAALSYNPATSVATLNPSSNLLPTARYTATVAASVADWAGNTLGAASVWSFETAVEPPMSVYHGDIHNHTSYSDGSGTPTQALATGKAAGFDFMAISDHSYAIDDAEWANTLAAVNAATQDGVFVALRGFEYTQGAEGHANVYNTPRPPCAQIPLLPVQCAITHPTWKPA
ncbi:MAG TPA: Ig-like domain-containing protein [Anaerolineae bacterium]|nr:Ig-like domain-containing protein [Anaerolineae bacterium]